VILLVPADVIHASRVDEHFAAEADAARAAGMDVALVDHDALSRPDAADEAVRRVRVQGTRRRHAPPGRMERAAFDFRSARGGKQSCERCRRLRVRRDQCGGGGVRDGLELLPFALVTEQCRVGIAGRGVGAQQFGGGSTRGGGRSGSVGPLRRT